MVDKSKITNPLGLDPFVIKMPSDLNAEELEQFNKDPGAWYDEQFAEVRLRDPIVNKFYQLQEMHGLTDEDMFKRMAYAFICHAVSLRGIVHNLQSTGKPSHIIIPGRQP